MNGKEIVLGLAPYASNILYVNTWPTKSTPWRIVTAEKNELAVSRRAVNFLTMVKEEIARLPVRVNIPKSVNVLSLPRYYAIFMNLKFEKIDEGEVELNSIEIIDIIGIRADLSPTRWSYRLGYWHPRCQNDIMRILSQVIQEMEKMLEVAEAATATV